MNLLDFKFDVYSSTGNDGIIEKIFEILNIKNGFFVEFGAWDGIKGSNCRKLWEQGWGGIFIEPDPQKYNSLIKNYKNEKRIKCIKDVVNIQNNLFDDIVRPHIDKNIDFCSIDIDGLDVEVFETFQDFLPTIVCIEGGQMLEVFHERLSPQICQYNIQQSLHVMTNIFVKKGYKLLCTYQDSFFVKEEYFDLFDISQKDLMEHYLDGLYAIHRRLPWIQFTLSQYKLKNKIIDLILLKSNYHHYGYNKRKLWAVEQKDLALKNIQNIKKHYFKKRKNEHSLHRT
tara:strand:+ start:349 stop:1203 length:855 start_codon:yes stop_codon:yes gene_type:complete